MIGSILKEYLDVIGYDFFILIGIFTNIIT